MRSSCKIAVSPAVTHALVGPTLLVRFARPSILEQDASTLIAASSDPLTTGTNLSDANGSGRICTCCLHTVLTLGDVLKRLTPTVGSIFVCQRVPTTPPIRVASLTSGCLSGVIFHPSLSFFRTAPKKDRAGIAPAKLFLCICELCLSRTIFMHRNITSHHPRDGRALALRSKLRHSLRPSRLPNSPPIL